MSSQSLQQSRARQYTGSTTAHGAVAAFQSGGRYTTKVKLEVRQPDDNSAGLFEWEVR